MSERFAPGAGHAPALPELLALLGGAALGAAHNLAPSVPGTIPLPPICGMVGLWGVMVSLRGTTPLRGTLRGALGLAGLAAAGLTWVTEVSLPGYFGLIFYFAVTGACLSCTVRLVARVAPRVLMPLAVAAAWTAMEFCRSHLFTGFPWLLAGTLWSGLPAAMAPAELGGVYLVSFLTVLAAALAAGPPERVSRRAAVVGAVLLVWLGGGALRTAGAKSGHIGAREVRVVAVQPRVPFKVGPRSNPRAMLREQRQLCGDLEPGEADLLVWSETMVPGELRREAGGMLAVLAAEKRCWVLAGGVIREGQAGGHEAVKKYNSALLLSPRGEIAGRYDKRHLVPFGEYVPLGGGFPGASHVFRLIGTIFTPGQEHPMPSMGAGLRLGISICYEDCFPELSRSDARRGAALLVNLTNDSWFRRSPEARQHLALAAFRAVETRRPLVRATNTGISALVSANGSIAVPAHGGLWEKGLVRMSPVVPVAGRRAETIYVLWGDFFGWGCSGLVLLTALVGAFWSGKRSQPGRPG